MELKEYIGIIRKDYRIFFIILGSFLILGIGFNLFQSISYKAVLTANVARSGVQETTDYRYDDFYRLQADERFADTVVRWMSSPKVVNDILNDSGVTTSGITYRKLTKMFKAERLSSQFIEISFVASDPSSAGKLSSSINKIINRESSQLNSQQKESGWFIVLFGDPVVKENNFDWWGIILASLVLGIFFGIWTVFIRHYLKK